MNGSAVIPSFRYKDAYAAIAWLETALGFVRTAVFDGPDGTVAHAQMTFGETGMIMLGSATNPNPNPERNAVPSEIGGRVTSPIYLVVADCDPVYAKAQAAGATILQELRTMDYGGRAFAVVDPEGYVWSVGEYDPWKSSE
jgi:uncharacterized glyoxalase superfamily protein PhnB